MQTADLLGNIYTYMYFTQINNKILTKIEKKDFKWNVVRFHLEHNHRLILCMVNLIKIKLLTLNPIKF